MFHFDFWFLIRNICRVALETLIKPNRLIRIVFPIRSWSNLSAIFKARPFGIISLVKRKASHTSCQNSKLRFSSRFSKRTTKNEEIQFVDHCESFFFQKIKTSPNKTNMTSFAVVQIFQRFSFASFFRRFKKTLEESMFKFNETKLRILKRKKKVLQKAKTFQRLFCRPSLRTQKHPFRIRRCVPGKTLDIYPIYCGFTSLYPIWIFSKIFLEKNLREKSLSTKAAVTCLTGVLLPAILAHQGVRESPCDPLGAGLESVAAFRLVQPLHVVLQFFFPLEFPPTREALKVKVRRMDHLVHAERRQSPEYLRALWTGKFGGAVAGTDVFAEELVVGVALAEAAGTGKGLVVLVAVLLRMGLERDDIGERFRGTPRRPPCALFHDTAAKSEDQRSDYYL